MSRQISPEDQDDSLEKLLKQQRENFVSFYLKNDSLFTVREKAEAFKYFDAIGEEISDQELYERRQACLNNLNSAENYAERIKNREQNLRREVQSRLGALPIAFDTKKRLLDEFFTSDLQGKEKVLKAVEREETRVAEKRRLQNSSIESKKSEYRNKLEGSEFQIYFSNEDREFAWNSLLTILATLRTNASRISRIQIFIEMLPGSLAHAKAQDALYQTHLQQKILDPKKRTRMLAQFREQSCLVKTALIEEIENLAKEKEAQEDEPPQPTAEKDANKASEQTEKKAALCHEYQTYYQLFPHEESPERFSKLNLDDQIEMLNYRREQHLEELSLLSIYLSLDTKEDGNQSIRLRDFKKLTLEQKKRHVDQFLKTIPDDLDASNVRGRELLKIVIEILRNKTHIVFASDQERIKLINERIKEKQLSIHFGPHHFLSIKTILADFAEERWDQPQTLGLAEQRLREREYVG